MKVEDLAYPWMKDFEILLQKIEHLETRIIYLERDHVNQKPQATQSYQGISNTAGSTSGQVWVGSTSGSTTGTRIKK